MIKAFEIEGFRRFEKIRFQNLGQINIFCGMNNVGKTTILEAIYGWACGSNVTSLIQNSILRNKKDRNGRYELADKILNTFQNQEVLPLQFILTADLENGIRQQFNHVFHPDSLFADLKPRLMGYFGSNQVFDERESGLGSGGASFHRQTLGEWQIYDVDGALIRERGVYFPLLSSRVMPKARARFVDILDHRDAQENAKIMSFLHKENVMDEFIEELSRTYPGITGISSIPYPNGEQVQMQFKTDRGWLPFYSFGDGVQRTFNLLGGMIVYRDAIHCLEEVDSTLHPEAQKTLAGNLVRYATTYNNQLFMTTHNIEFVDTFLREVYGSGQDVEGEDLVRIITLRNDPITNQVRSRVLTGREAFESREDFEMELR